MSNTHIVMSKNAVLAWAVGLIGMGTAVGFERVVRNLEAADKEDVSPAAIARANMDLTVQPGEDFYRYVNGNWLKKNPIPSGQNTWGTFAVLREHNANYLRAILESALAQRDALPGSPERLLGDFYHAAMDASAIEMAGASQLDPFVHLIDSIRSKDDLADVLGELHRSAAPQAIFLFYRDVDVENPLAAIAALKQGGCALPARDDYLNDAADSAKIREQYRRHVQAMFSLLGQDKDTATASADVVLRLEIALAKNSLSPGQERDPKLTFNRMKLAGLQSLAPNFSWKRYFDSLGLRADRDVNVVTTGFFSALSDMIQRTPVAEWKTYLKWNVVNTNAHFLSEAFVNANFEFFAKTLTGTSELAPRWQRVLAQTEANLGWTLARVYVKRHFSPRAHEKMLAMIKDIREAFQQRLADLDWMSEETKTKASFKLSRIVVNVGFPARWPDLNGIQITRTGYVANVARANGHQVAEDIKKLGQRVDRSEFGMTPQQVNAYYSPPENKIVFPAGILQPPFFHETFDDAVNYGAIGAVIAHEFTHAFDDEGSQYDADGTLRQWWTVEDLTRFKAKQRLIIDQFDAYTVLDNLPLNGKLTVGENIADLGGVRIAFQAFQQHQARSGRGKDVDGFTPEQRFFIAWAQLWRVNKTPEAIRMHVKTSTTSHSPFRVIGPLSNMDEFINAFDLRDGDRMVRPREQRIRIW